jgi:hypothetical protein
MKEKGKLTSAWRPRDANSRITSVCFDGRFVWAATWNGKTMPDLALIDPRSGKVREFGPADGLPGFDGASTKTLFVSPLDPGRAAVVGSGGRAWVAVVSCDPVSDKTEVRVILEATEVQDRGDRTQWSRTKVTFRPTCLVTLTGPPDAFGKPQRRLLVSRGDGTNVNAELISWPLLIDPERSTTEVFSERFLQYPNQSEIGMTGGAMLVREQVSLAESRLIRVGFPTFKKDTLATGLPNDIKLIAVHEGRIHVTTAHVEKDPSIKIPTPAPRVNPQWKTICRWWTLDAEGKNLRLSADNMPEMRALAVSSHYGLVALVGPRGTGKLHTVTVSDPQSNK